MIDNLPPNDDDAERGLIGAVLVDNELLEEVPHITRDHFRVVRYGAIWAAMWRLYSELGSFDVVALSNALDPSKPSLAELMAFMTIEGVPQPVAVYAERVRQKATLRALKQAASTVAEAAMRPETPIAETLNTAMAAVEAVLDGHVSVTDDTQDARAIAGDVLVEAWDWKSSPATVRGMASGLGPVDEMLGGFEPGWLYSIAGRPGQGKSALLARLAWGFAENGCPVLIFSLEMTAKAFMRRMGCQIAHVDATRLRQGKLTADEFKRYTDAVEVMGGWPLMINARAGLSIREMQTIARRHERKGGLCMVMVDTLNRVKTPGEKAYERMTQASHAIADWAHNSKYAIMCAVQMSRANENMQDKRPTLAALRDSGAIEEDNDVILGLYRPHYYDRDNDLVKNEAELRILKFRDGDSDAQADLYWRPECLSFDRGERRDLLGDDQTILGRNTH